MRDHVTDREVEQSIRRCVEAESFVDRCQRFAYEVKSLRLQITKLKAGEENIEARIKAGVWREVLREIKATSGIYHLIMDLRILWAHRYKYFRAKATSRTGEES